MKDFLINTLETLGFPVFLQGTFGDDPFPETFITFFTLGSNAAAEFDNETALTAWQFQVTIYGNNPLTVESGAAAIRKTLKAAGFIPQGKGRDIPSEEPTYTGWTCEFYILESEGVTI